MEEEILARLITFRRDVVLAIVLNTGRKMITDGSKILAGKLSGDLASFILRSSKEFLEGKDFGVKRYGEYDIYFERIDVKRFLKAIGGELVEDVITLDEFMRMDKEDVIVVDVRSPREYKRSTIPNAINIPLFLDEEYEIIGKTYKKEGKEKAIDLALDIVEKNLKRILGEIKKLDRSKTVVIFCARGGLRSQIMATILKLAGYRVKRLIGGFKGYNLDSNYSSSYQNDNLKNNKNNYKNNKEF
ncbi:selenouridine synthase SelU-like subunit [Methanofervidicoccus sp. A16]|uniref:selenouridine synthase SelU-like subunit n=1 Tax=Methanofervidicoccus sp. A16 TaxID=2607662 RepID=UPI00118A2799|nr:selenouridine synthase SelU-like subunit [Methanofervidicoccus sp. A16]AXI25672.1 selenouridine synthase SelU-like subunit [Methanofervidicoccus sp. A16]